MSQSLDWKESPEGIGVGQEEERTNACSLRHPYIKKLERRGTREENWSAETSQVEAQQ